MIMKAKTLPSIFPLIILCASVFLWRIPAAAEPARKPNILFLLADDFRPDAIGAMGNDQVKTPNLDRLASRGLAFNRAHIMGGMQGAVCVCSRAALLTSRTLFHCPDQPTGAHALWPATFAKEGYRTFQIGKWHNGPKSLNLAFQDSKNTFFGGMSDHYKIALQDYEPAGKYGKERQRIGAKYDGEIFADTAVEFLQRESARPAADQKPWFLWTAFTNPHDPRTPPPEFEKMYDPAKIRLPANYMSSPPVETGVLGIRDEKLLPVPRTEEAVRREIALYYATITHLDAQIGRILDALEKSGQADNTLIVFAGDNGLAIGSHGLLGKQNVYEHSDGVPLILSGPGIPKNKRVDDFVYLLDLFPTACELTGIATPATVEGKSFAAIFRGEKGPRTTLFSAYTKLHRMVRDNRWKLIEWTIPGHDKLTQLFDLQSDPDELRDVSKDSPQELKRLHEMMLQYKKDLGDVLPN